MPTDLHKKQLYILFKQRIKLPLFILIFLLIAFQLNNYWLPPIRLDKFPSHQPEIVIKEPESVVVEPVKKAKKPFKKIETAQPVKIEMLPLESEPIRLLAIDNSIDTLSALVEMKKLLAQLPPQYKIHRFYIPPVEYKMDPKDLIIPAGLLTVGVIASHTDNFRDLIPGVRKNPQNRSTPFDDKAQLVPPASLFVLDIFGKEKHHFVDQTFLMGISYGLAVFPVRFIKDNYDAARPYGGNHSFPSGHTATAFVGAHLIYKEFKDSSPWLAYSGYAMGTVVAASRVINDKHWVCDVMAGAAIAIIGTELAYLIYFPIRNFITDQVNKLFDNYILLTPIIRPENMGVNLTIQF